MTDLAAATTAAQSSLDPMLPHQVRPDLPKRKISKKGEVMHESPLEEGTIGEIIATESNAIDACPVSCIHWKE